MKKPLYSIFSFVKIVSQSESKTVIRARFVAFDGEYTLFAGLEECLKFVQGYKFQPDDIAYLRTALPDYVEAEFYDYLATLEMNDVTIYAMPEGKPRMEFSIVLFYRMFRLGGISAFTFASCRRAGAEGSTARNNSSNIGEFRQFGNDECCEISINHRT